eukprot:gene12865-17241_t
MLRQLDSISLKLTVKFIPDRAVPFLESIQNRFENISIATGRYLMEWLNLLVDWLDPVLLHASLVHFNPLRLSFRKVYENVTNGLRSLVTDLKSKISFAVTQKKWNEVSVHLKTAQLDLPKVDYDELLSSIKQTINIGMEGFISSIDTFSPSLFVQLFETTVVKLTEVKDCYDRMAEFDVIRLDSVTDCELHIQEFIRKRMEDCFATLLPSKNFQLLEADVSALREIRDKIVIIPMQCRFGSTVLNFDKYLDGIIDSNQKQIDDILDSGMDSLVAQEISAFAENPPVNFLESLKACHDVAKYSNCYNSAKSSIIDKFSLLLRSADGLNEEIMFIEQFEIQYNIASDARQYVTLDIKAELDKLCHNAKAKIDKVKQEREIEKTLFETEKLPKYIEKFKSMCMQYDFEEAKKIKACIIVRTILKLISQVESMLTKNEITFAIPKVAVILHYFSLYRSALDEIANSLTPKKVTLRIYTLPYRTRHKEGCHYYIVLNGTPYYINPTREQLDSLQYDFTPTINPHLSVIYSESDAADKCYALVEVVVSFINSCSGGSESMKRFVDPKDDVHIKSGLVDKLYEVKLLLDTCQENHDAWDIWDGFMNSTLSGKFFSKPALNTQQLRNDVLKKALDAYFKKILELCLAKDFLNNEECTSLNESDRDKFYVKINKSYNAIQNVELLANHINMNIAELQSMKNDIRVHFTAQIEKIHDYLKIAVENIPTENMEIYSQCSISFDNFRSIFDIIADSAIKDQAIKFRNLVANLFMTKFKLLKSDIFRLNSSVNNFGSVEIDQIIDKLVVKLKTMSRGLPYFSADIDQVIDDSLDELRDGLKGSARFGMIALRIQEKIQSDESGEYIKSLLRHKAFDEISTILRNKKTGTFFTILHVLGLQIVNKQLKDCTYPGSSRIESDDMTFERRVFMYEQFLKFDKTYWDNVERGLNKPKIVMNECKQFALKWINDNSSPEIDRIMNSMAYVFAYWTLTRYRGAGAILPPKTNNSSNGNESKESATMNDPRDSLIQPHPAQICAIFRLFGIDKRESIGLNKVGLEKHLIQVFTGEGKSVILAITSTLLGMMGYAVDCACYSSYLSERDYGEFQDIFKAFGVDQRIKYGTFGTLCEDFINSKGDLREMVEVSVTGRIASKKKKDDPRKGLPRVLLIDEVDTFFSPDYYGKLYEPYATISDPTITAMIRWLLWDNRSKKLSWDTVSNSPPFSACLARFPQWRDIVTEMVKGMVCDLKVVTNPNFKVDYVIDEFELSNISEPSMNAALVGRLYCGGFSYAKIPDMYHCVLGVTGTLKQIVNGPDGVLIRDYSISKFTYLPSVYGNNQLEFHENSDSDVMLVNRAEYFLKIKSEIDTRIKHKNGLAYNRAVFVFFNDLETLNAFYEDPIFINLKRHANILSEKVSAKNKEGIIRAAASSGKVVLMTKAFGRGTDFICYDDRMIDAGGTHVIQTFLSEQVAEEVQIKGRTARQGNLGSYSMILLYDDLERFLITHADVEHIKHSKILYSALNDRRNKFYTSALFPIIRDGVKKIEGQFIESQQFYVATLSRDHSGMNAFLMKYNKVELASAVEKEVSRTVVLMDATGSMHLLLNLAKNAVKGMFENMIKGVNLRNKETTTLKEEAANINVQFMVYRNYNAPPELLLQESRWELLNDNPSRLYAFTMLHRSCCCKNHDGNY